MAYSNNANWQVADVPTFGLFLIDLCKTRPLRCQAPPPRLSFTFYFNIKTRRFPDWMWYLIHALYLRKEDRLIWRTISLAYHSTLSKVSVRGKSIVNVVDSTCSCYPFQTHKEILKTQQIPRRHSLLRYIILKPTPH